MKTRMDNRSIARTTEAGRQNGALADAELEIVTAAGGGTGINPSRTDRGTTIRSA